MNGKSAKKLRRLARVLTIGKSKEETELVYNRLKTVHKSNKKENVRPPKN